MVASGVPDRTSDHCRHALDYDVWGARDNLAARLESSGVPRRVQVSKEVVDVAAELYEFTHRGVMDLKGKGKTETFFLVKKKQP